MANMFMISELARKIQQSLLPESKLRFRGVSISCAYAPCDELGGDIVESSPSMMHT